MTHRSLPILASLAFVFAATTHVPAQDADSKEDSKVESKVSDPISYFLGYSVGQSMRQSGLRIEDFDLKVFLSGYSDGIDQKEAALTDEQLRSTQQKIQSLVQKRRQEELAANKQKGIDFLTANLKAEGVKALDSGLQYKVIKAGKGPSPDKTDTVKVHYTGKLIDGTMFDSSVQRGEPAVFRVDGVIQGWQQALQKMNAGAKWMLYIPSDLAYGPGGSPPKIGPNEVLVFEVELLEIQ